MDLSSTALVEWTIKAMTHQPTQLLSRVWSGPVGICVIGLQLDFLLHSSLIPDSLVGSRPTYDSTVELGWVMCRGLSVGPLTGGGAYPNHLSMPMSHVSRINAHVACQI